MGTLRSIVAVAVIVFAALPAFAGDADDPQKDKELAAAAESAREMLQQHLADLAADMKAAADAIAGKGLSSPETRAALKTLCAKHTSFVDCATIDPKGILVAIEPAAYHKHEGKDVGMHPSVKEAITTHKPVMSDVFMAVEGFWAIDFEWPILAGGGEADSAGGKKKGKAPPPAYEGSVSAISKPAVFMNNTLKPYYSQGVKDVWIMQTDGKVISSRDPDTIGNDFLPTTTSSSESTLPQLLAQIVKEPKGTGSYRSYVSGQGEARQFWCGWTTFTMHGNDFRVVVFLR